MNRLWIALGGLALIGALALAVRRGSPEESAASGAPLPSVCRDMTFEGAGYVVCEIDPAAQEIRIAHNEPAGRDTASLADWVAAQPGDASLVLAMNAGMYRLDGGALGLLIEDGREVEPLNLASGPGNFFLAPNGVFAVAEGGTFVIGESEAFGAEPAEPRYATQSGPLLAEDGVIHPALSPNGSSRHVRNGVGLREDGRAILVISRDPVSLGAFARLFVEALDCPDALYLDGVVSALWGPDALIVGGGHPAGPILAVRQRR